MPGEAQKGWNTSSLAVGSLNMRTVEMLLSMLETNTADSRHIAIDIGRTSQAPLLVQLVA
jgi:hypothetical protein